MAKNLFGQPINKRGSVLGCDACPLSRVPGTRKIRGLDRVRGRAAMLWTGHPSKADNGHGLELSGSAGKLLWDALADVGLKREDFDVQNAGLRCWPSEDGRTRPPEKRELECCSVYNEEARERNRGRARVHLVLGDLAGQQLLRDRFKKDHPVFWHDQWESYVVLGQDPAEMLKKGGTEAGGEYFAWRDRFRAVRATIEHPGRWGYVKSRDYRAVRTEKQFDEMEKVIRSEAAAGRRVSVDIEDGDDHETLLVVGFGVGHFQHKKDPRSWTGRAWSVVLDHPQSGYQPGQAKRMKARVAKLLEDGGIKKTLQNGNYDSEQTRKLLRARIAGYDYDTMYGTYLRYSYLRSCSLENLTYRFFPEFMDYKDTVAEWMPNLSNAPLDRLVLRNCGDCDVTKRLEEKISPQVPAALVEVYIHAGFTLSTMEKRGPLLDWEQWKEGMRRVPKMIEKLDRILEHVSGVPNFDCDSPPQVAWLLYDHLKLPEIEGMGRSTVKEVLELLSAETNHPVIEVIQKRRAIGKIKGTYLEGFAASARVHEGQLRTIWWLTGAVTGRLRSGKGDRAEAQGILNLQNLHGSPMLQTMIVSDSNWRLALKED